MKNGETLNTSTNMERERKASILNEGKKSFDQ